MSAPYGEIQDDCSWTESDDCWTNTGIQSDFIGSILTNAGQDVDYFTSDNMPAISPNDYSLVIVQDPSDTLRKTFDKDVVEDSIPDLLEYVNTQTFIDNLTDYFHSGGNILLIGDAVKLLEDGALRLNFGKTITTDYVANSPSLSDDQLPSQWPFIRGNPFCCANRSGSGTYKIESSNYLTEGSVLSNISLVDGCDYPTPLIWSEVVYYPTDGVSLLDVRVEATGEYVLDGTTCSPTEYSVTVDDVLTNFVGYTTFGARKIYYIGGDSYFDFEFHNYTGYWHCNDTQDITNTITSDGQSIITSLINDIIYGSSD